MTKRANPFDARGIRDAARWMAPRLRNHGMFQVGLATGDGDMVAIASEDVIRKYITVKGIDARVSRSGAFVGITIGDGDDVQTQDISLPLAAAIARELGMAPKPFSHEPRTPPADLFEQ